jgi:hypothetical protein
MEEFILIFRGPVMGDVKPTQEQINAVESQWADWMGSIAARGRYVGGTRPGQEGKTVMPGNVITDGPYAEVKEILMGLITVKAESMDEALEFAKGCPILFVGGNVEVRTTILGPAMK